MEINLYEKQREMELLAIEETAGNFQRTFNKQVEAGAGADTGSCRILINRYVEDVAEAIDEWLYPSKKERGWNAGRNPETRELLRSLELSPVDMAGITLRAIIKFCMLSSTNGGLPLVKIYTGITKELLLQANYKKFRLAEPTLNRAIEDHVKHTNRGYVAHLKILKQNKEEAGVVDTVFDSETRLAVGARLFSCVEEKTNLVKTRLKATKYPA